MPCKREREKLTIYRILIQNILHLKLVLTHFMYMYYMQYYVIKGRIQDNMARIEIHLTMIS